MNRVSQQELDKKIVKSVAVSIEFAAIAYDAKLTQCFDVVGWTNGRSACKIFQFSNLARMASYLAGLYMFRLH